MSPGVADGTALSVESSSAMISDPLLTKVHEVAARHMEPVFTYLANAIRDGDREIPRRRLSGPWLLGQPVLFHPRDGARLGRVI